MIDYQIIMKETFTLMDFFILGGPVMWVLLLFSMVALTVVVERLFFLLTHDLRDKKHISVKIYDAVAAGEIERSKELVENMENSLNKEVFCVLLNNVGSDGKISQQAAEAAISKADVQVENHLGILSAIGSIAPVTGFLGTVAGMINTFMSIAKADDISAKIAASGIFEALITTAYGLIIAVFSIVFYHILSALAEKYIISLENNCKMLMAAFELKKHDD